MPKAKASARRANARTGAGGSAGAANERAIDCALELAAERGWRRTTFLDIAAAAKLSPAELHRLYPSKGAILAGFIARIDRAMLDGGAAEGESVRDRLFEALMRRFEALRPQKPAVETILRDSGTDPVAALCGVKRVLRSMSWALELAGVPGQGILGRARAKGLAALYLACLRVWLGDDTPDLSRTMAALDKGLRRLERIAEICRPVTAWRARRSAA
jgi:AcrR family transcriptional regulator